MQGLVPVIMYLATLFTVIVTAHLKQPYSTLYLAIVDDMGLALTSYFHTYASALVQKLRDTVQAAAGVPSPVGYME